MDFARAVLPSLLSESESESESEDVGNPDANTNAATPPCKTFLVPSLNTLHLPFFTATCRGRHRPTVHQ